MQLDLQLTDRQGLSRKFIPGSTGSEVHRGLGGRQGTGLRFIKIEERREGSKLCALDVDLQDVNEIMAIVFHEPAETPHLNFHVGTVIVDGSECPGLEMGSVGVFLEFRTPL